MVVVNNETLDLIKQDIDRGNIVFAGSTIAQYIESKNPHENLTLALRSIKEDLKEILSQYPDEFIAGQLHYSLLEEVMKELGWEEDDNSFYHNGWEHDTWFDVLIKDKGIGYHVFCSWADPRVSFNKFIINETESDNCGYRWNYQ